MKHIRNKNELLEWLEDNAPRKAIANAMLEGKVELLGAFHGSFGGVFNMGWIVKVTSKRGLSWDIVIIISRSKPGYFAYTIKKIPWGSYVGGNNPLFAGDNPEVYEELKCKT